MLCDNGSAKKVYGAVLKDWHWGCRRRSWHRSRGDKDERRWQAVQQQNRTLASTLAVDVALSVVVCCPFPFLFPYAPTPTYPATQLQSTIDEGGAVPSPSPSVPTPKLIVPEKGKSFFVLMGA